MKSIFRSALVALLWPGDTRSENNPSVYAWGNNVSGQLGLGSEISKAFPNLVQDIKRENISKIYSSGQCSSSIAINTAGEVFTWGNGLDGILAQTSGDLNVLVPGRINFDGFFQKVAVGGGHMAGITSEGKIVTWGLDDCGQCGHEIIKQIVDPRAFRPQLLKGKQPNFVKGEIENYKIVDIACGKYFTVAVTEDGRVFS